MHEAFSFFVAGTALQCRADALKWSPEDVVTTASHSSRPNVSETYLQGGQREEDLVFGVRRSRSHG